MKIFYAIIYIAILGVVSFPAGRFLPKRLFSGEGFFFASFKWENDGHIYEKLGIKSWHKKAPDMSRIFSRMTKKSIETRPDYEMLLTMVRETCIAELVHWCLFLLGFFIPVIAPCPAGYILFAAYTLFANLPFILIQRYNRPRLKRLMKREKAKKTEHPVHLLILSCNTGGGHNSVANSLKEKWESEGCTVDIRDALSFISGPHSVIVSLLHSFSYNHAPVLFNTGWRFTENHRSLIFGEHSIVRHIYRKCAGEINRCLTENGYSVCICTHVFAGMLLTESLRKYPLDIKTGIIETDYAASPGAEYCDLDYHFLSSPELRKRYLSYNIKNDTIVDSSIPLRKQIYESYDSGTARRFFNIPKDKHHILVMFGSIGSSSMKRIIRQFESADIPNCHISVICGNEKKLRKKLAMKCRDMTFVNILGFISDISIIMDSADIVVTKSGGISLTELAVKKKPAVLFRIVDGCEKENTDFFFSHKAAVVTEKDNLWKTCAELLSDTKKQREITEAARSLIVGNGAQIVYDKMERNY